MTSSTETTDPGQKPVPNRESTAQRNSRRAAAVADDASADVTTLAARSSSQADFLQRIAADLADRFSVEIVAVTHVAWDTPMMLVSEPALTNRLDGPFIADLLRSSTTAPSACDIPLRTDSNVPQDRTRGLHVRLLDQNGSCAVLLVYHPADLPDVPCQIRDLQRLAMYAKHCRSVLKTLSVEANTTATSVSLATSTQASSAQATSASGRALRHFHHDLELTGTAYRIANETRRILAVDRVTVLLATRGKLRVESVSGVTVVDRRANAVAAAEEFSRRAIVLGRPIVLPSQDPLPPQIAEPLDQYLDETDVAAVAVMPLYRPSDYRAEDANVHDTNRLGAAIYTEDETNNTEPIAVILLESFSDDPPVTITPLMQEIGAEAAIALANSMEHQRIFGLRFLKRMGDWFGGRYLPYTTIAIITAIGLLAASMIIQVDHKVIATGFAEPSIQQNVFARNDGIVQQVFVHDGQRVTAGETLLRLENADLETNAETLSGEIQTTTRRLASIGSMLLDPATDAKQSSRMAIEQQQLLSELTNIQNQLKLVREQLSELDIQAPIDGIAAGWQLKRKLADRPVTRGDHLLTIVRDQGPWQLRLEIPDKDAAEILHALQNQDALEVKFAAASHPRSTFIAALDSIATAARRNQNGTNVLDAMATIESGNTPFGSSDDARTGVEATAKITCGRRSVLSSWFGDVADFINRNILFYIR